MYKDSDKLADRFKKGNHPYPNGMPVSKDDFLKWAQHFFGLYSTNGTLFGYGGHYGYLNRVSNYNSEFMASGRDIAELRAYGGGLQSPNKHKKWIKGKDPKNNKKIVNISYDPPKIMPKFRDQVLGALSNFKFSAQPSAVDQKSTKERERLIAANKLMVNPYMQGLVQEIGRPPTNAPDPLSKGLETSDDVDTLVSLGGFPLLSEIMAKDAIDATFYGSEWADNLERMLDEDLFDIGMCAIECVAKEDGSQQLQYIDPERLVARPSDYNDFRDIDLAGYITEMTIADLRESGYFSGEDGEKQLYLIAKSYANFGSNSKVHSQWASKFSSRTWREDFKSRHGNFPYDGYRISVFKFYFKAGVADTFKIGKTDFGYDSKQYVPGSDLSGTMDLQEGEEVIQEWRNTVYQCHWIVGTPQVYGYGQMEYNAGNKLPIRMHSTGTTSAVERCIAILDDITTAVLKQRQTISKMAPGPRMIIDVSLLEQAIKIGGQNYNILDLMEIFTNSGILVVKSKREFDQYVQKNPSKPIEFMQSGVLEDLRILVEYVRD